MLKIKHLPLVATLMFSGQSLALTDNENRQYQQLTSGDISQIKQAARGIAANSATAPKVLDVLMEVVLTRFPLNYEYEIDTLAWACRAIGESQNPRYKASLETVISQSSSNKLRKYAKKALKKINKSAITEFSSYTAGTVNLAKLEKQSATSNPSNQRYKGSELSLYQIASNDLFNIKRLAQRIASQGSDELKVTDALAQFIANNYKIATNHNADTLAWSCKALAQTGSGRYKALLDEVAENTNSRAMRKHCEKAAERLPEQGPFYQDGDLDLAQLLNSLKNT